MPVRTNPFSNASGNISPDMALKKEMVIDGVNNLVKNKKAKLIELLQSLNIPVEKNIHPGKLYYQIFDAAAANEQFRLALASALLNPEFSNATGDYNPGLDPQYAANAVPGQAAPEPTSSWKDYIPVVADTIGKLFGAGSSDVPPPVINVEAQSNTGLYVGLGVVSLLVIGGIVYIATKK